jgi:hypothetical protein
LIVRAAAAADELPPKTCYDLLLRVPRVVSKGGFRRPPVNAVSQLAERAAQREGLNGEEWGWRGGAEAGGGGGGVGG